MAETKKKAAAKKPATKTVDLLAILSEWKPVGPDGKALKAILKKAAT